MSKTIPLQPSYYNSKPVKCLDSGTIYESQAAASRAAGKTQKNGLGKAFRLAQKANREPLIAVFAGKLWVYLSSDAADLALEEARRIVMGWRDSKQPQYKDQLAQRHIYPEEYWPEFEDEDDYDFENASNCQGVVN